MSYFTDYAENALADKMRGTEPTYPANWYLSFGISSDDDTPAEIADVSMPRIAYARSLANFAGTQGAGTTLASSGTSKTTTNNNALVWSAPASDLGTATHLLLWDALSGGNCWMELPLGAMPILTGVAPTLAAGTQVFIVAQETGSDYLANKLIDEIFRAQAWAFPASIYGELYTVAPTSAGGGTPVSAPSYARAPWASTMAAKSGTQGDGTTSSSTGTGGRVSNNVAVSYPAPLDDWGDVLAQGWKDAATAGNLLWFGPIPTQSILSGSPAPTHAPGTLAVTVR